MNKTNSKNKKIKAKRIFNNSIVEIVVILNNLRSVYNVGSFFRTSDALGIDKIYLVGFTPDPENNPKMNKVSLGAEKTVQWEKVKRIGDLLKKLKREKNLILAIEQSQKSKNIFDPSVKNEIKNFVKKNKIKKVALIFGPEVKGLEKRVLEKADLILEIPMFGQKESLNVSVAFGIIGYEIRSIIN